MQNHELEHIPKEHLDQINPRIPSEITVGVLIPDSGDVLAEELALFVNPASAIPFQSLVRPSFNLICEALVLSTVIIPSTVLNSFANVLLNRKGRASEQAAMGIAIAYNSFLFYSLIMSMYDKFGIDWSRSFGAKQFNLTKRYFYQAAIVLLITFVLVTVPTFLFSEWILVKVGTLPSHAAGAAFVLKGLLIANSLESISELFKNFMYSQGLESVLGKTMIFSFLPSVLAAYYFVEVRNLGIMGWIYSKIIFDGISLIISMIVMVLYGHPETWGKLPVSEVWIGLGDYFVDSFKYALGSYTEYLGYLISNYFVILTHDENQIAAFTIKTNQAVILYCVGIAFATIMRTRMNILIGKKLNHTARNFAIYWYKLTVLFSLAVAAIVFLFRDFIARVYTGHTPALFEVDNAMMVLLALSLPQNLLFNIVAVGMKTVGLIEALIGYTVALMILLNAVALTLIYILGFMSSSVAFSLDLILNYVLIGICTWKTFEVDWTFLEISHEGEDVEQKGLLKE